MAVLCFAQAAQAVPPADEPAAQARFLYHEARFQILDQDYQGALDCITKCRNLDPSSREAITLEASILEHLGRRHDAIALYQRLIRKDPDKYAYLHFELGYLYSRDGREDAALAQFKEAERIDKTRGIREQALTYMRLKKFAEVQKELARLPADDPSVKYLEAQALMYQKDFDGARKKINQALAMDPDARLKKDLTGLMTQVDWAEKRARPWRLWLTVAADYNDNVFADPLTDNPALQEPRDEGDFSWLARAVLLWRFTEDEDSGLFGTIGFMNRSYFTLNESDYANFSGSVYWRKFSEKWFLRIPFHYSYYFSGSSHESRLQQFTLFPTFKYIFSDNFDTNIYGTLQRRIYFTDESNISRWAIRVEHNYYFGNIMKYLRLAYGVYQDIADNESSGYTAYEVHFGGGCPVIDKVFFFAGITYAYYEHETRPEYAMQDDNGQLIPWDRADHQFRLNLRLHYRPTDRYELILSYFLTNNDSNVSGDQAFDPYNYRQNIISLMLVISL